MTQSTITALRHAAEAHGDSATGDLLREAADALSAKTKKPMIDSKTRNEIHKFLTDFIPKLSQAEQYQIIQIYALLLSKETP